VRPSRVRRHRACASEFDYQGWKNWGRWKRSGRRDSLYEDGGSGSGSESESSSTSTSTEEEEMAAAGDGDGAWDRGSAPRVVAPSKDCWNTCDYPSECRWGRDVGVHTPMAVEFPTVAVTQTAAESRPPTTFEAMLKTVDEKEVKRDRNEGKPDFWGALMASATRRKSVPPSSPLATVAEEPDMAETQKDRDGDVVMVSDDSGSLAQEPLPAVSPVAVAITAATPVVATLKDFIWKSSGKSAKTSKVVDNAALRLRVLEEVKSRDSGYYSTDDVLRPKRKPV